MKGCIEEKLKNLINTVIELGIFLILILVSVIDLKKGKIHNYSVLFIFLYALCFWKDKHIENALLIISIFFFTILIFKYILHKDFYDYLGGGDIKLFCVLSFFLNLNQILYMFLFSGLTSSIFMYFMNIRSVPFGPFITIGFLLALLFV